MIIAYLELLEDDIIEASFTKEFLTTEEMYLWLRSQMGHPWLSYILLNYEEQ